ncbi:MAG: hypothetical protein IKE60_20880 [Reyranella sp.]|uniref:hypothetical protein n=1 Tax=Reyranella sp. TaxID=1929291 RepID=UPI0025EF2857|nr:hypothetical protein [Reyranella sp.]MBR2817125.1 hypothetical protein [Reyranella sp.]
MAATRCYAFADPESRTCAHPDARNRFVVTSPGLHMPYFPLKHMDLISPRLVLLIAGERAEMRKFSELVLRPVRQAAVHGARHGQDGRVLRQAPVKQQTAGGART